MVLAAAIAATGVTYAGLRLDASRDGADPAPRAKPVTEAVAIAQAARTGKSVEVTALRTARSTTWARPDGLMAKRLYSSPVRAKVGGEWKDIDTGLRRTDQGWEPRATNTRMVFSAGSEASPGRRDGDESGSERASRASTQRLSLLKGTVSAEAESTPLVTLHVDDHDLQLTWPGPVPAPIIDGSRALYPEIFPGADLVLTADDDGFAQLIVLKNRQAAADPRAKQLAYGITSATLTFRLDPVSGILEAEDINGDEVAMSPTPLMWDSSGRPAVTDGGVGATAQPTAPEAPEPPSTVSPEPEDSAPPTTEEPVESDEQADPSPEVLPSAEDGTGPAPSDAPLPTAPPEPTPAPSPTGSAATLGLPLLDGPSPDSRGELVEADLSGANWVLTPNQDFLTDPATTYPVFVDPSVKKHVQNWTTAYSRHPNATFYNGKNFNKGGTHEARVGFESDTWGTSRSYFNIDFDKDLRGTKIKSARLYLLETYSWSCSARAMSVHLTGPINSRTNWKNAPKLHDGNKFATKSFAHGYKSGCRDAYETFNLTKAAQKRADEGAATITFGLRARDENSQYSWKKFLADGSYPPILELEYNRRPSAPDKLDLGPDAKCTTTTPYVRMGSGSLTFTARASDKDKNLDRLDFDLWPTGKWGTTGDLLGATGNVTTDGDKGTALRTTDAFPTSRLTNGTTYSWRVRAFDDAGGSSPYSPAKTPCRFVLDTSKPKPPKVSSVDFPNADGDENGFGSGAEDANWSTKKFGTPGAFTVRALSSDVVRYEYGFNAPSYPFSLSRKSGTAITVSADITNARPPAAGPNVLYVRTVDGAGNVSEPTKYLFYVTPRDQADTPGDFTGDGLADLMTVTDAGNLALYRSRANANADGTLGKGSGDFDFSMPGAYRGNPDKDPNGDELPPFVAVPGGHFKGALITHNGDIYGGDGLQDLVVRVEGKLWVYPGDGYGAVNVDKRREILLPEGAPDPASLTQIVAAGDATGDGRTDFFATAGDQFWVFSGYHGATIDQVRRLAASTWLGRDIVTAQDISGDGVTDIVYRNDAAKLMLRKGIAASGGGVDLESLTAGANSSGGTDTEYGSAGWSVANIPMLMGTPDANGDAIPDVWTVRSDGSVRFYAGGRTVLPGSGTQVVNPNGYWTTRIAIG
ncbi:DNRLRE domain-containing protein [Streptomyces cavernae]|uniref:DNRLRE domain-containing protein n=1 Tax=Streptomyces cavernae TaxID=2259034 RepID=UPI001EE46C28|nr:DNRLRE domain-containing protein [Streptomyces cavernae]